MYAKYIHNSNTYEKLQTLKKINIIYTYRFISTHTCVRMCVHVHIYV